MTSWASALDELEERLRRQEAVAAMTTDELPDDALPEVDGPLPPELRARAAALFERTQRLQSTVEAQMAAAAPRRHSYSGANAEGGTDHGCL